MSMIFISTTLYGLRKNVIYITWPDMRVLSYYSSAKKTFTTQSNLNNGIIAMDTISHLDVFVTETSIGVHNKKKV